MTACAGGAHGRKALGADPGIEDRYCADMPTQIASVYEVLRAGGRELMRNHLEHCATAPVRGTPEQAGTMYDERIDLCTGTAGERLRRGVSDVNGRVASGPPGRSRQIPVRRLSRRHAAALFGAATARLRADAAVVVV